MEDRNSFSEAENKGPQPSAPQRVLITGGAGFIGSRLARRLLALGHEVSILDKFSPQIHGDNADLPADLRSSVQLFRGDVRDLELCRRALEGQTVLVLSLIHISERAECAGALQALRAAAELRRQYYRADSAR